MIETVFLVLLLLPCGLMGRPKFLPSSTDDLLNEALLIPYNLDESQKIDFQDEGSGSGSGDFLCGEPHNSPKVSVSAKKIVDGKIARRYSWPWQVSIHIDKLHECGGSIISQNFVVTAAHCFLRVRKPSRVLVMAGIHRMSYVDDGVIVRVKSIKVHSQFIFNGDHDIALVELEKPLEFGERIQPICLPGKRPDLSPGTVCYVTGWGETRKNIANGVENILSDHLMQASTTIVEDEECERAYWVIPRTVVCASSKDGDTCQGDSGGPLACLSDDGRWFLAGITSFGDKCGGGKLPGVYTQVDHYLDWIEKHS